MTTPRPFRLSLIAVALLALTGCSQPAARTDRITARDEAGFDQWVELHRAVLTADDIKELNEARQQIRYKVMTQHPGLMSADFGNALYAEIDGRTLRELLMTSYALQIESAEVDIRNYQPLLDKYHGYEARRDLDADQRQEVQAMLAQLDGKVAKREAELAQLKKRLAEVKQMASAAP